MIFKNLPKESSTLNCRVLPLLSLTKGKHHPSYNTKELCPSHHLEDLSLIKMKNNIEFLLFKILQGSTSSGVCKLLKYMYRAAIVHSSFSEVSQFPLDSR